MKHTSEAVLEYVWWRLRSVSRAMAAEIFQWLVRRATQRGRASDYSSLVVQPFGTFALGPAVVVGMSAYHDARGVSDAVDVHRVSTAIIPHRSSSWLSQSLLPTNSKLLTNMHNA